MSNTEQQIKLILKLFVHFLFSCHVAFKCFIILSNSKYSIWRFLYWKLFLVWHFCLHTWNILNIDHRAHDVIYWCVWSPIETLFHVFPESCSLLFLSGGDDKPPVWSERCFTAALRCHSFKFWCIFRFFFFLTCILLAVYKSQLLNTERRNECSSGSSSVSETPLDNQGGGRELLGRN